MNQDHLFKPTPELMQEWLTKWKDDGCILPYDDFFATQAACWGANEQLEQAAKWLDTYALFSEHLTITPPGDALREAMRPKPQSSLKQFALAIVENLMICDHLSYKDGTTVLEALKCLPD